MDDTEPDLADAADDLSETLESLREELREPPRGPLDFPRPPRPDELLALTERYTIPALIALLETNIRLLELLAAAIRIAQGRPVDAETKTRLKASEFAVTGGREGLNRLTAASRTTLEKLDEALADLQDAAAEGSPENPEAERLLEQARELRAEIDDRLAEVDERERTDIDVQSEDADESDSESSSESVDVDAELASLKEDMSNDDETPNSK
jgi:hypothetical protein